VHYVFSVRDGMQEMAVHVADLDLCTASRWTFGVLPLLAPFCAFRSDLWRIGDDNLEFSINGRWLLAQVATRMDDTS
jgi:hypothetical protein